MFATSRWSVEVLLPNSMVVSLQWVIFEWLPMQPNCKVSCCSRGKVFTSVTFANAGLTKFPVLPVSSMMYALHPWTLASIISHLHISDTIQECRSVMHFSAIIAVCLVCITYQNILVPSRVSSSPLVQIAAIWMIGWFTELVWVMVILPCGVVTMTMSLLGKAFHFALAWAPLNPAYHANEASFVRIFLQNCNLFS